MPSKRKGDSQVRTRARSNASVNRFIPSRQLPLCRRLIRIFQQVAISQLPLTPSHLSLPCQFLSNHPRLLPYFNNSHCRLLVTPALGQQPVVQPALDQQQVVSAPQPLPALPLPAYTQGELDPLPIGTYNDYEIFISDVTKDKIWNGQYVQLVLLLKQNFASVQSVAGTLAVKDNQLSIKPATSKIKQPITSLETWSDAFINFILVFIQNHNNKASELLRYMSVIRGAAANNPISKWLCYDTQFRLCMGKDPTRSWSQIDSHLSGDLSATTYLNAPCYDYKFKESCARLQCTYAHVCLKCKVPHPASSCNLFKEQRFRPRFGYATGSPNANFSQNEVLSGFRPFRPSTAPPRPIRPFRQPRPQGRFMGP